MNVKEYIESGILEAYVLGALTPQEQAQVMADIALYPELATELRAIEATMQQFASAGAMEPPAGMEDKIWNAIQGAAVNASNGEAVKAAPSARIIPLQPELRKGMDWKYAAALIGLVASLLGNLMLWNRTKQEKDERLALAAQMEQVQSSQNQMAQVTADYQKANSMMADTGMQTIVMHTMQAGHPMAATIFWSKSKGEAYVAMNALPEPPKGMQYQLWVIQNGKPVSMGVLPNKMANTPAMQKVDMSVTSSEAFAISLEKEGGNPTPTVVYVLGKA